MNIDPMEKIRVLLADDHDKVRKGFRKYLSYSSEIEVIGEADNGEQVLPLVESLKPDVVLLDVEMPGLMGFEVANRLTEANLPVKVLAVSGHNDQQHVLGMLANGASGYLTKEEVPNNLLDAIQYIIEGKRGWISPQVASKAGIEDPNTRLNQKPTFVSAEIKVLKLLARGSTDQQIADELKIPADEVRDWVEAIRLKLGSNSRFEIIIRALQEDLI
jgi:DNA-binding NarL/FixJ family response regulator